MQTATETRGRQTSPPAAAAAADTLRARRALQALNFFMADMQAGIGPFLGVFLQQRGWSSGPIGPCRAGWAGNSALPAIFYLAAGFGVLAILSVLAIPAGAIDHRAARGLEQKAGAAEDCGRSGGGLSVKRSRPPGNRHPRSAAARARGADRGEADRRRRQ